MSVRAHARPGHTGDKGDAYRYLSISNSVLVISIIWRR